MLYRIFVYGTQAVTKSAPAISSINTAISTNSKFEREDNEAAHYMNEFDLDFVKKRIQSAVAERCKVIIQYPPWQYDQIGYLYIATSYEQAKNVLPSLYAITSEQGLVLFDAETKKVFFKDLIDDTFISLRTREQTIKKNILDRMKPIWSYRKLYSYENERDKDAAYVVTLTKEVGISFEERVRRFYTLLKDSLVEGESLTGQDKAFIISKEWYSITYVLEGYRKHSCNIGYIENSRINTDLIHRMSCYEAFKWIERNCTELERNDIYKRMTFCEMMDKYPNPADRFVASVRITKWQRKQIFEIRYSGFGYYGSEILFHIVPSDYYKEDAANISVLKIEEESASYILPFVDDIYPHFYERYYLAENHLPTQMWNKIVTRIEEAREMILKW